MIKYEINQLHKIAQMGKECCEHVSRYVTEDKLLETVRAQRESYKELMHNLEEIYYGLDDISPVKSIMYSWMIKTKLSIRHNTEDIIRCILKGNVMGMNALASFIQCPFNSEESKVIARDMLQSVNSNIEQIMSQYLYQEDNFMYEY